MTEAEASGARVLWAGAEPPGSLQSARISISWEQDPKQAAARAAVEPFAAVITDAADLGVVTQVLGAAARNDSVRQRFALATYDGLPELVRDVEPGLVDRVLAKPVVPEHLVVAVTDPDPSASVIRRQLLAEPSELRAPAVDRQLRDLVERVVELPSVVIRPLVATDPIPRLQLVCPVTAAFGDLRRELPAILGWPLKASGSAMGRAYRRHPVRRVLGNLSERQEAYCLGRDRYAYVAFFPWYDDSKVTLVVGFEDGDRARVEALHRHAVELARELPLPTRHQHASDVYYDPDYDWVITRSYVGPDRRRKRTSFINRYTFRGRRKALMPNEFASVGSFVDIAPRWAWVTALAFVGLFAFDTVMTFYYVGGGKIGELNPVMRWALHRSPVLFWGLKLLLALAAAFVAMRWHLWRPGRWLFAASVAIYAVLDAYWVVLYLTRAIG